MTGLQQTVWEQFQIRKTKGQKAAFRAFLCEELEKRGYAPRVEGKRSKNVVVGEPEAAQLLFTAHYDTCAVLPVPNFITPRSMVWYVLYQLLLVVLILALAVAAEVGLLLLWEDCPLWAAMGAMYGVILFCGWWMLAGPANRHTANDNTSGVLTLLELAERLPAELRQSVCLVFFDNEELGLLGSGAFAKAHRAAQRDALVVNFDCVGDGESLQCFPARALKREEETLAALERAFSGGGGKSVEAVRGFGFYPSDQAKFRRGVGVCALKQKPLIGYYMDRIHTGRDTVLMEENLHQLAAGAVRLAEMLQETDEKLS